MKILKKAMEKLISKEFDILQAVNKQSKKTPDKI
jgi:hypothetical protein